jgi:3-hydroxybutyryl-CoA dehydrogenase
MPHVAILGAGTMGAGIAQVAATSGWTVTLIDQQPDIARDAVTRILARLDRLVEKGRLSAHKRDNVADRLHPGAIRDCGACELVIEAIIEDLGAKCSALSEGLAACPERALIATNTSSLSVGAIGRGINAAHRVVGMHFFNPVPLMPLVEVIAGEQSEPVLVDRAAEIATEWGKTPVRANDTPGFIVNRVARGYYLEPMRMLDEGVAGIDEIDQTMKQLGGFRMGPFELMDLVGIDVNYTVSCSVWEQLGKPARLTPHPMQQRLFQQRHFGRKSKQGWYSYQREFPIPAAHVDRGNIDMPESTYKAVRMFCEKAADAPASITEQYIFARTLIAVINEAALAADDNVADESAINTAMRLGTNYPRGPLEWADRVGRRTCRFLLDCLEETSQDGRFAPAESLRV